MRPLLRTCLIILLLIVPYYALSQSSNLTLRTPILETEKDRVILSLLEHCLYEAGIKIEAKPLEVYANSARLSEMLMDEEIDIVWAGMSQTLEETLLPVRIPIFKGMLGHRVFVIHQHNEEAFKNVSSIEDLKRFTGGTGQFWSDTPILKHAGLNIMTATQGVNLWNMLEAKRFDYIPLAVNEPWDELDNRENLHLMVEPSIALIYPLALYFYVHPKNKILHDQISSSMNDAINNGLYDDFLYKNKYFTTALKASKMSQRRTFHITNPNMHPLTPVNTEKYWLKF